MFRSSFSQLSLSSFRRLLAVKSEFSNIGRFFDHRLASGKIPNISGNYTVFDIGNLYEKSTLISLTDRVESESNRVIEDILGKRFQSLEELVGRLDYVSDTICQVADILQFFRNVPSIGHRFGIGSVIESCFGQLSDLINGLNANHLIHERLSDAFTNNSSNASSSEARWIAQLLLLEFESSQTDLSNRHVRLRDLYSRLIQGEASASTEHAIALERFKLARDLKHKSYAEMVLRSCLLTNSHQVFDFVDELKSRLSKMPELSAENDDDQKTQSVGECIERLSSLIFRLFNVTLSMPDESSELLWSPNVVRTNLVDANGQILGHLYIDCGNYSHSCHYTIRSSRKVSDSQRQIPVSVIQVSTEHNFKLDSSQQTTLFHEFGHAMHSLLTQTRYQHASGTRCATDLAEVPSQLFEYFRTMKDEAGLSKSDLEHSLAQIEYDQLIHSDKATESMKIQDGEQRLGIHIVEYGAKIHSYLVSKAISRLIFRELLDSNEKTQLDPSQGIKLRRTFFEKGGECDPQTILTSFFGRTLSIREMTEALTS